MFFVSGDFTSLFDPSSNFLGWDVWVHKVVTFRVFQKPLIHSTFSSFDSKPAQKPKTSWARLANFSAVWSSDGSMQKRSKAFEWKHEVNGVVVKMSQLDITSEGP